MSLQTIPIAEYSPDMPALNNPGSGLIQNCVPRTTQSYGPFPALMSYGGALNLRCQGSFSCIEPISGDAFVFAGDANDLYDYVAASTNPNTISNGSSPYMVAPDGIWSFALFGPRVIAADFHDALQTYTLGVSSTFLDLANGDITALTLTPGSGYTNGTYALTAAGGGSGFAGTVTVSGGALTSYAITNTGFGYPQNTTIAVPAGAGGGTGGMIVPTAQTIAPRAKYISVCKGFLVAAYTFDATGGSQSQRVWWSAQNDPTNWPTPGTAVAAEFQSSYNDLFGDGGQITGIVGNLGTADGAVFMEHAIWRMVYAGPPVIFDFFPAEGVRGTSAPGSIAQLGGLVYYLGEDGFYTFDGTNSIPIGFDKVDRTMLADLDITNISRITSAIDPVNKLYLVAYPGQGNIGGNPNRLLAYHWPTQKWAIIVQTVENLLRAYSFGVDVLDTVGGVSLDTAFYNTYPMDSQVWTNGNIAMGAFDVNNKLSYFNGAPLQATIETSEQEPFEGRLAFIQNSRPQVDGGLPSVSFAVRNRLIDQPVFNSPVPINFTGTCPQTVNGRYVRAQINIPAGSSWQHCQGVQVEGVPNGVM